MIVVAEVAFYYSNLSNFDFSGSFYIDVSETILPPFKYKNSIIDIRMPVKDNYNSKKIYRNRKPVHVTKPRGSDRKRARVEGWGLWSKKKEKSEMQKSE